MIQKKTLNLQDIQIPCAFSGTLILKDVIHISTKTNPKFFHYAAVFFNCFSDYFEENRFGVGFIIRAYHFVFYIVSYIVIYDIISMI